MLTQDAVDYTGILERPQPEILERDEENSKLAGKLMSEFQDFQRAKEKRTRVWELLQAYHRGDQYLYREVSSGEVVRVADKHSKRLWSVNNKLNLASRTLRGKLVRHMPTFTVAPASGDPDQVQAALAASAYIDYFRYKEQLDVLMVEVYGDVAKLGNGFWELLWDPNGGRELAMCGQCSYFDEDPEQIGQLCPACAQEAQDAVTAQHNANINEDAAALLEHGELPPEQAEIETPSVPTLESTFEGDAVVQYLDPWEFFPEPGCRKLKYMRKWMTRRILPVSEIARRFPDFAPYVRAESGLFDGTSVRTITATGDYGQDELKEHAALITYHEMPSEEFPDGRQLSMVNDVIVEDIDSPYFKLFQRPNVFMQHWERENDSFWADAWAEQAWPRQKELNEVETNIREHEEQTVHVKVMVPIGSQINSKEIGATTAQVIKYNPAAGKVEAFKLPDLNQGIYERRATLTADIYAQAAVSEHEAGLAPQDESGRAIAIVESQADAQVEPIMVPNRSEVGAFWRCVVQLVRAKYHPDRQFKVLGDTDGLQQFCIRDMNLLPGYDLRLEQDDGLSKIQSVRINQLLEINNATGVFGQQALGNFDVAAFQKAGKLKLPGVGPDLRSVEHTAAEAMLKRIEAGDPNVQPMPWDDPQIFGSHFVDWLKTHGREPDVDQAVLARVYGIYNYYLQWAMVGAQPPVDAASGAAMAGGATAATPAAPGSSAGTGGSVEGGGQPGAAAAARVKQADAVAEGAARTQSKHEN